MERGGSKNNPMMFSCELLYMLSKAQALRRRELSAQLQQKPDLKLRQIRPFLQ